MGLQGYSNICDNMCSYWSVCLGEFFIQQNYNPNETYCPVQKNLDLKKILDIGIIILASPCPAVVSVTKYYDIRPDTNDSNIRPYPLETLKLSDA